MMLAGSCDQTELEGKITPSPIEVATGETVTLSLEVPSELEKIHREMWRVVPDNLGTIECVSSEEACRKVFFKAEAPGTGIIEVWGFYKQTNPQFIAEAEITVTE